MTQPTVVYTGSLKTIMALPRPQQGEYALCTDDNTYYCYNEASGWTAIEPEANSTVSLNLYDLNKQIMAQMPTLADEVIATKITLIDEFVKDTLNCHYMMYGKEISYFTIFQRCFDLTETVGEAVIDCLKNVGEIRSIELTENKDAIEIWVHISYLEDPLDTCLYLFPYDSAIVKVGG